MDDKAAKKEVYLSSRFDLSVSHQIFTVASHSPSPRTIVFPQLVFLKYITFSGTSFQLRIFALHLNYSEGERNPEGRANPRVRELRGAPACV